jgi:hypothetical protein
VAESTLDKEFVKSWARHIIELGRVQEAALNELGKEPAARQQVEFLYRDLLSNDQGRRDVALRLAIAEYQEAYGHQ